MANWPFLPRLAPVSAEDFLGERRGGSPGLVLSRRPPSPARTPTTAALVGSTRTRPRPPSTALPGLLGCADADPGDEVGLSAEDLRRGQIPDVLGHIGSGEQPGAPLSGSGGDVLSEDSARTVWSVRRQVWARRTSTFPLMSAVFHADRFAPGSRPPARPRRRGRSTPAASPPSAPARPGRCSRPRAARRSSGPPAGPAVLGDDLVRADLRPRAPVPHLPQPRTRLLGRMVGSPGRLIAVDVAADLSGPGAERTHVRDELTHLVGLRVSVSPCAASTDRNSGLVATAACPMPLISSMQSRTPTGPSRRPSAHTRALICRWR